VHGRKREDLDQMLQTLGVNAANPVCVMTQDTARNFLAGSSSKAGRWGEEWGSSSKVGQGWRAAAARLGRAGNSGAGPRQAWFMWSASVECC